MQDIKYYIIIATVLTALVIVISFFVYGFTTR